MSMYRSDTRGQLTVDLLDCVLKQCHWVDMDISLEVVEICFMGMTANSAKNISIGRLNVVTHNCETSL